MLHKQVMRLMGNRFEISVLHPDENWANEQISSAVAEIQRIEKILTTFSDDSVCSNINANAGIKAVEVSDEVFNLILRCQKLSEITQGAFDITYGSLDKRFWNFDTSMTELPDKSTAQQAVALINYKNLILDNENKSVFLKNKGMRIGFGGIGKGYAAEMAKKLMQRNGVESGIVNAAGDLSAWGYQEDGSPWTIGIANPEHKNTVFSSLNITNTSVATSGNYEKFVMIGGKRYSHTIDPKTGFPVSGIKSVTVITQNAEMADALATPVTVMGLKVGLNFINQLKQVGCIIIDDNNKIYCSDNINIS
ncbi:MAG: FAD:protein FMN transferase [Bacteroidetes bacterium]|nr:FAD:protein FMN transferase [Bacteroidota bacterium]